MHFLTVCSLLVVLGGSARAIPTEERALHRRVAPAYPATLTDTTPSSVVIRIFSDNPRLNNRNVQLRPNDDAAAPQIAAVDPWSPVLLLQLRGGVIFSQRGSFTGTTSDLGPVMYFRNASSSSSSYGPASSLMEVYFAHPTEHIPPMAGFELINVSKDAEYNLYQDVGQDGVVNGFLACDRAGAYFQLFYYTYTGAIPDFGAGCEFVAVQVGLRWRT